MTEHTDAHVSPTRTEPDSTVREIVGSKWNVQVDESGVRVCYGDHHRSEDCEWVEFAPRDPAPAALREPTCEHCGKTATCLGRYPNDDRDDPTYACDDCCAHGCEDGFCFKLPALATPSPREPDAERE